jgi:outer membrane protein TolC
MIKKILLITAGLGILALASGQDKSITLDHCLSQAIANHPLFDQYELLNSSSDLKIKNLNKNYLPDMNINGDAHYQSNVTEIPTVIPSFAPEPLSKDQYKIALDVNEMIYDGSLTKRNKDVEYIDNEINQQNVGIDLYRFKDRVISCYFNIIALQASKDLLDLTRQNLQSRLKEVESGVKNGMVLATNA